MSELSHKTFYNGVLVQPLWKPVGPVVLDGGMHAITYTLSSFSYVEEGTGRTLIHSFEPKRVCFHPAGELKTGDFQTDEASLGVVKVPKEVLDRYLPANDWHGHTQKDDVLAYSMLCATRYLDPEECSLEADYLMSAIFQRVASWNKPYHVGASIHFDKLQRVLSYVNDNLTKSMTIDELADVACISPFHFSRKFKRLTGYAPHQYVLHRRILRARALIASGLSLAAVALGSGFASQSHMTRHFKALVGLTPKAYKDEVGVKTKE